MKNNQKGLSHIALPFIILVVAVLGFGGWYVWKSQKPNDTPQVTVGTQPQTSETVDPYAGWKEYCSAQEKACFKYPPSWTSEVAYASDPNGDGIAITSPDGTTLTFVSTISGLGGYCDPLTEPHILYDKVIPLSQADNLYAVEQRIDGYQERMIGIIGRTSSSTPAVGDTGGCMGYMTFPSHDRERANVRFYTGNAAVIPQGDAETVNLILQSYHY